jgi:hypothetical protein
VFLLKAPSGHKRSCFVDNDEERLDQDGRILVYDLVYYAVALASVFLSSAVCVAQLIPKSVSVGGERVGMGQWGLPRSCTQALPAGRVFRIGEGVNQFEEDNAG